MTKCFSVLDILRSRGANVRLSQLLISASNCFTKEVDCKRRKYQCLYRGVHSIDTNLVDKFRGVGTNVLAHGNNQTKCEVAMDRLTLAPEMLPYFRLVESRCITSGTITAAKVAGQS